MKTQQQHTSNPLIKLTFFILCLLIIQLTSCKKFLSLDPPPNQITAKDVFENEATATAAVTGIYSRMMEDKQGFASGGIRSISYLAGLTADELREITPNEFYTNQILPNNAILNGYLWSEPYQYIYTANSIIEQLYQSPNITISAKQQLSAEAKFIRSFCYYYLTNLFGAVPLYLSTDYRLNASAQQSSKTVIYQQLIADLIEVQNTLPDQFPPSGRVRPYRWAATALLARCYLDTQDWTNAAIQASKIINRTDLFSITENLDDVFQSTSREAIWQLYPPRNGYNSYEAKIFTIQSIAENAVLANSLLTAFDANDLRKKHWITKINTEAGELSFPTKYKSSSNTITTEYQIVFRLAEQYLIRAEARSQLKQIEGAKQDLNVIRNRAGLADTKANDTPELLIAVLKERQKELFTEWGHRWFDLKRYNLSNAILSQVKEPNWQPEDELYPIPADEISRNQNIKQNQGYKQ